MTFKVITAVATEPVTLAEARLHLKIDSDNTADDSIITALITAAREFAEHYTEKAFAGQTLEMVLDAFPPEGDGFDLDMPPVSSITHIKYTDLAGVEQTLNSTNYVLSSYGPARRVTPAFAVIWPDTQDIENAVRIRYVTGYTSLTKAAKAALLMLIGHLYEHRQSVTGLKAEEVPMGARCLLDTIKQWGR